MTLMDDSINRPTAEVLLMMINGRILAGLSALIKTRWPKTGKEVNNGD
jgi:hypothetical protein